jgi:hypothetical protein
VRTTRGPSGSSFPPSFGVAHDGVCCCDELGAILGCAGAELEQRIEWRRVTGRHDHPLRLTQHDHYLVVVFGSVEQSLEFAHRIVGSTPVVVCPTAVTSRGRSVPTGSGAITGCPGALVGRAAAFLGGIGGLVRQDGVTPIGGLISLLCGAVRLGGDVIALGGTLIIDPGLAVPIIEIIALLLTAHGPALISGLSHPV